MIETIPLPLLTQKDGEDQIFSKLVLDLTFYLVGPSINEFEYLINLYSRACPYDRLKRYTITELEFWPEISDPVLTTSARRASLEGKSFPYFEPTRIRIQKDRSFDAQFWDGNEINLTEGSWSFSCRRIHSRSTGLHSFVRITIPLQSNPDILRWLAYEIVDNVDVYSGHGGISFIYDPWQKEVAFDRIYVLAKRFWGVDIECLNSTLPLMNHSIKGVSWITVIGNNFLETKQLQKINSINFDPVIKVESLEKGVVFVVGDLPTIGDVRAIGNPDLNPYFNLSSVLNALFPTHHPDFSGALFFENGNTNAWVCRFLDPNGWGGSKKINF